MALSIRRDSSLTSAPEALVFSDGFPDIEPLNEELDDAFGVDQWIEVAPTAVEHALTTVHSGTAFAVITAHDNSREALEETGVLIRRAREAGLLVLLVVGDISTRSMHQLLKDGVADFAPFPEPEGALTEAIDRLRYVRSTGGSGGMGAVGTTPQRKGRVLTVYGAAGGVGASTMAVNLAWELALLVRKQGRRVAILDFNFQYGSVATFLDVPRREAVYELVSDAASFDATGLQQALSTYQDKLWVLTAPRDALPLDIVTPTDVRAIIDLARESFDYVVIDMPQALMNWSEPIYTASDEFITVMEIDMRSAQNLFRFLRTLKAESMDLSKLLFVLNRAPGMMDLTGKARVKRVAESLGITYSHLLPDGGKEVVNACDQGIPLAELARSNPVRKEILRLAQRIATEDVSKVASAG